MLKYKYLGLFIKAIVFLYKGQNELADLHITDFFKILLCLYSGKKKSTEIMKRGAVICYIYFFSFYYDMINYVIIRVINEVRRHHSQLFKVL